MRVLLDEKIESLGDRVTEVALVGIVVVGMIGIFTARGDVPIQVDNHGFTSFVPPIVAAAVYTFVGLFMRVAALPSSHPYVRWFGRAVIGFFLVFEIFAFLHAS